MRNPQKRNLLSWPSDDIEFSYIAESLLQFLLQTISEPWDHRIVLRRNFFCQFFSLRIKGALAQKAVAPASFIDYRLFTHKKPENIPGVFKVRKVYVK